MDIQTKADTKIYPVVPRATLYQRLSKKSKKILKTLIDLLDSPNESVRLGAAKVLANKIVPDLSAVSVQASNTSAVTYKWLLYGAKDPILTRLEAAPKIGIPVLQGDMVEVAATPGIVTNNPDNRTDNPNNNPNNRNSVTVES